jgi:hypothetical protein
MKASRFRLRRRAAGTWVFGGIGSGKSTLLRNMIASDIAAGLGLTAVDPHDQFVEDTIENHIPRHRPNDVICFNAKKIRSGRLQSISSAADVRKTRASSTPM